MMRSWLQDRPSTAFRHILQNSVLRLSLLTRFQIVFFMQSQMEFAPLCVILLLRWMCCSGTASFEENLGCRELLHSKKQLFDRFPVAINGSARGKFKVKGKYGSVSNIIVNRPTCQWNARSAVASKVMLWLSTDKTKQRKVRRKRIREQKNFGMVWAAASDSSDQIV